MTQETKGTVVALQINKDNKRVSTESTYQLFEGGNRVYSVANKPSPADIGALGKTETAANSSATGRLNAVDDRDVKPDTTGISKNVKAVKPFFVNSSTLGTGSDYSDLLMIDTYSDSSGGKPNALAFNKLSKKIYHLQPDFDGTSWGTAHAIYTEANKPTPSTLGAVNKAGDTMTGTLNINYGSATTPSLRVGGLSHKAAIGVSSSAGEVLYGAAKTGGDITAYVRIGHTNNSLKFSPDANTQYEIYHKGFKPTAADVNAFARNCGEITSQDWNTLTNSGSYTVSGMTGANKPAITGHPNIYTYGTLLVQNTGKTINQMYITDGNKIYIRDKYAANAWGSWSPIASDESIHINTSVDLDDFSIGGTFNMYKGGGVVFTNAPSNFDFGTLQVIGKGRTSQSFVTQILTWRSDGRQMIRVRNDGSMAWTPWRKIYSEVQKPTAADVGLSYISQDSSYGAQVALSGKFVRIGCRNTSWCHLETDATSGFYSYDHFEVPTIKSRAWVDAAHEVIGRLGVNAEGTASGQGLQYYGKTVAGGTNDAWLRLNPHNQFNSGIYCGSNVVRTDGQVQVGAYTIATKAMRLKVGTGTSWNADKDAFIDMTGAPKTGSTATYLMRYRQTDGARIFAIDTLDQTGQTYLRVGASGTLCIETNGNVTASGNSGAYSDERVKTDVKTIDNALDKVLKIRGVTYKRTDIESDKRHAGVIAQEIEKVLPEVVSISKNNENGIEDFRSVSYGNISALLIEAIKEQQVQIESLKKEINLLKSN